MHSKYGRKPIALRRHYLSQSIKSDS